MVRMMTRSIFLYSMRYASYLPCFYTCRAPILAVLLCLPCSYTCRALMLAVLPCLSCFILYACRALMLTMLPFSHAPCLPYSMLTMLHACHAPCLPRSVLYACRAPCSMLILSATGIMGYPTIIPYHDMISIKPYTMRYPILMFILYLFERYNIYPPRSYTILYYRRYNIRYSIRYTISFRYVE